MTPLLSQSLIVFNSKRVWSSALVTFGLTDLTGLTCTVECYHLYWLPHFLN
jgi:hypothetical protein